eukprot:jgi/Tetstr1/466435/TSEL_010963.t1
METIDSNGTKGAAERGGAVGVDDIVPSGAALQTVQGWLGVSNAAGLLAGLKEDQAVEDGPRPARLGLGAKFLAHKKAVALTGGVEKRLSNKILNAAARRKQEKEAALSDSNSDSDNMSRARAFTRKPAAPAMGPGAPRGGAAGVGASGGGATVGKRRKKKAKRSKQSGCGSGAAGAGG